MFTFFTFRVETHSRWTRKSNCYCVITGNRIGKPARPSTCVVDRIRGKLSPMWQFDTRTVLLSSVQCVWGRHCYESSQIYTFITTKCPHFQRINDTHYIQPLPTTANGQVIDAASAACRPSNSLRCCWWTIPLLVAQGWHGLHCWQFDFFSKRYFVNGKSDP